MSTTETEVASVAAPEEEASPRSLSGASGGIGGIAVAPLLKLLVDSQKLAPSVALTLFSQDEEVILERTLTVHELAFLSATFMEAAAETLTTVRKAVAAGPSWAVASADFDLVLERARSATNAFQEELKLSAAPAK